MAEAKVADFCDWIVLPSLLLDEYVINLDVCMNDSSLMNIVDAFQYIMGPVSHLLFLHWFVFYLDAL